MSVIADQFRNLAEAFDNQSEDARRSADTAKAAALGGLRAEKRQDLIAALGAATNDAARVAAVQRLVAACVRDRDRRVAQAEQAGLSVDVTAANAEINLLLALLAQLQMVVVMETLREHFRAVASSFD